MMKIGNVKLSGRMFLSPMAGVTDVAFRRLCREQGAALAYTEFVHASAIVHGNDATQKMMEIAEQERPAGIQIFGSDLKHIVDAAKAVEHNADIIDFNLGCPAPNITDAGCGAGLLKDLKKVEEIFNALTKAVNVPVTVKTRLGLDEKTITVFRVAELAEQCGLAAISIHGRTMKQGYSGVADWSAIKKVKESAGIPVIGNGDVKDEESAQRMLNDIGADAAIIGRAAMTDPSVFARINHFLEAGDTIPATPKQELFLRYYELAEEHGLLQLDRIKTHAHDLSRGMAEAAVLRRKISAAKKPEEIRALFERF